MIREFLSFHYIPVCMSQQWKFKEISVKCFNVIFFSHLLSYCFYNLPYTCRLSLYRFYCRCSFILRYKFAVSHWKPNLIDKLCLSSPPVSILSPIMWILDHMYILLFELFWITTTFIVNFNFNESFIINIFFPSFKKCWHFLPMWLIFVFLVFFTFYSYYRIGNGTVRSWRISSQWLSSVLFLSAFKVPLICSRLCNTLDVDMRNSFSINSGLQNVLHRASGGFCKT